LLSILLQIVSFDLTIIGSAKALGYACERRVSEL